MKYDVFISYSSEDAPAARSICEKCEENGLKCFLDVRDIPHGQPWPPFIYQAICDSSVMVAVFSQNYNISEETDREISLASIKHLPILVYRIDTSEFEGAKAYYFSNLNWYSSSDKDSSDDSFIRSIRSLLIGRGRNNELPIADNREYSGILAPSLIAANNGDAGAQFYLGQYYNEKGEFDQAVFWYRKAAKSGLAIACYNISNIIFKKGIPEDYKGEGFDNAEKAYKSGFSLAGLVLAWCYVNGREAPKDYKKGWYYLNEFLETKIDNPESLGMAYYLLGNYYRFGWGDISNDINRALEYWKKSAEYDNQDAIYNLGASYLYGNGVAKDEKLAFNYFQRGAEKNDSKSLRGLALCYYKGISVDQNIHKAIELYKQAAVSGELEAYADLGAIYLGSDLPNSKVEASKWFYEGAVRGDSKSLYSLGVMYYIGTGVPKNQSEGIKLLKLAAEKGYMDAIVSLKKLGLL